MVADDVITCRQQFSSRVAHINRYIVLVPDDRRLRVACRRADHHRVAILLDRLQRRVLNDAWITAGNYTKQQYQIHRWNAQSIRA